MVMVPKRAGLLYQIFKVMAFCLLACMQPLSLLINSLLGNTLLHFASYPSLLFKSK